MTEPLPPPGSGTGAGPDPATLRALRQGEPAAVDAWYRREHPIVYRLCFGFLASTEEAEDVAQDAMLHLYDRLSTWDPARAWRPWRTSVVANLCRDRLRRVAARRRAETGAAEARSAEAPSPADVVEHGEAADALRAALASLSPREREAFVLRDLEGVPTAEVAAALAIGPSSVRSLVTLARRRLRGLLGPRLAAEVGESDA